MRVNIASLNVTVGITATMASNLAIFLFFLNSQLIIICSYFYEGLCYY